MSARINILNYRITYYSTKKKYLDIFASILLRFNMPYFAHSLGLVKSCLHGSFLSRNSVHYLWRYHAISLFKGPVVNHVGVVGGFFCLSMKDKNVTHPFKQIS